MNIKKVKPLKEEKKELHRNVERFMPLNESEIEHNNTLRSIIVEENQFEFDSGYVMGAINIKLNNSFGLYWHAKKSSNVEEFIQSVQNFLNKANVELTASDISRLKSEYGRG